MAVRFALDQILARKRLSLAELADRTGLPEAKLRLLRDGEAAAIRLRTIESLCHALNCAPGELFHLSD